MRGNVGEDGDCGVSFRSERTRRYGSGRADPDSTTFKMSVDEDLKLICDVEIRGEMIGLRHRDGGVSHLMEL